MKRLPDKIILMVLLATAFLLTRCEVAERIDDEDVIRRRTREWLQAESNRNLDSALTFIAEDGVYLANDWPMLRGHEEIAGFLKAAFDMPMGKITGGTEQIEVSASGDMAYEIGRTKIRYNFASGDTVYQTHYVVIWKKIAGEWKAIATSVGNTR